MMLARYADVVFAISPMHANDISSAYGIRHDRIQVWPSTVDLSLFDPSMYRADRRDVRSELGFEDMFTLMYHGVLTAERGLDELVQAVKMANDEGYRVGLLLLGKGSSEQQLRSLIASLDLSDNVRLHASVPYDQVPRFIAACDAGAIPLPDQEQWRYQAPTKLLEYLAMQKAVIATEIPAHRWLMRGYEQAFYCGKGHQSEIKAAIVRCINARSVRQHPDQHAADQFSSETVADKVVVALSSK
jgi:glycosyltransferase involved in cell wall biosynthesis